MFDIYAVDRWPDKEEKQRQAKIRRQMLIKADMDLRQQYAEPSIASQLLQAQQGKTSKYLALAKVRLNPLHG